MIALPSAAVPLILTSRSLPDCAIVMVCSLGGVPVLYFDFSRLSCQVPANGSAAMRSAASPKRANASFAYRIVSPPLWWDYTALQRGRSAQQRGDRKKGTRCILAAMKRSARSRVRTSRTWKEGRVLLERWRRNLATIEVELKQPRLIDVLPIQFVGGEPVQPEGKRCTG